MTDQVIYSRWEYPIGDRSSESCFEEYRGMSRQGRAGITVGGIQIAIRNSSPRAVIVLTYDDKSDLIMKLKLAGISGVKYNDYRGHIKE